MTISVRPNLSSHPFALVRLFRGESAFGLDPGPVVTRQWGRKEIFMQGSCRAGHLRQVCDEVVEEFVKPV